MIRILRPGDEAVLENFLQPKIVSSMFLVSNLRTAGLVDNGRTYEGTYAAVFEEGQLAGVAAVCWNGSLVLQSPVEHLDGLWRTAAAAAQRPITRLIGPLEQVEVMLDQLDIGQAAIQMDEPEKLYSLNLADMQLPPKLESGEWEGRLVSAEDVDLMTRWRVGYAVEALCETESPELWQAMRDGVQRYTLLQKSWILEADGQPVSTSSFNAATKEVVQVGGVWTPPELRSQGYGRGAVAASLQAVRDEGVHTAILFTGIDNIPAQKAYEALGFCHIGDYRITLLKDPLSAEV